MSKQRIHEPRGTRSYFASIPHMADEDLNLYEYRLYGHYKHICGENNKPCEESVRDTAKATGMSHPKVIEARRALESKGYIQTQQTTARAAVIITLVDIWPQNMTRFSGEVPAQGGSLVSQGGSLVSQGGSLVSQPEHENGDKNKELEEQESLSAADAPPPAKKPRPRDLLFDAVIEVSKLDPVTAGKFVGATTALLRKAGYTPEDVRRFGVIWYTREFPGGLNDGKPPSPPSIAKYIGWVKEEVPIADTFHTRMKEV